MSTVPTPIGGCTRTLAALAVLFGGLLYLVGYLVVWAVRV